MKLFIAGLVVLTSACALDATDDTSDTTSTTTYENIGDFNSGFFDVRDALINAFAAESHPGVTSLGIDCSVTSVKGNMHDCVWTLSGAAYAVDANTASIATSMPWYECHVAPKTTAAKFISTFGASKNILAEPIPGTTETFDSVLADCLTHPIGGSDITVATSTSPTYVEAGDYYSRSANRAQWDKTKAALKLGFDMICGDTFCGGDYGNMQDLAFACSVTRSTGNIKECAWLYAGSYAVPTKTGLMPDDEKSWRCEVPVKGTISQLMTVVNATSTTPVLDRPLPGGTATAYDALLSCLP